jgi:drug/metabolite transporter (DMT)-like permease
MIPLTKPMSLPNSKSFKDQSYLYAILVGMCSSAYHLIDTNNLSCLKTNSSNMDSVKISIMYTFLRGISISSWLGVVIFFYDINRKKTKKVIKESFKNALLTGLGIYFTYSLVLMAMYYSNNSSYIPALRQTGIIFSFLLGVCILKEPIYPLKIIGILLLFIGILLVLPY